MISSDDVKAADREITLGIVHDLLANAADYTFVFTGNIDLDSFRPLVEQYIATLPASKKSAFAKITPDLSIEPALGSATEVSTTPMETPQTYVFIATYGTLPYSMNNKLLASISGQILSNRLLKKVREEMGAVYSIGMQGDMDRMGKTNVVLQTAFPMKPELKDETLAVIHDIIYSMAENVSEDELQPIKEYM